MLSKETLDFVIPVYNESACIDELIRRLLALKATASQIELGVIFVDDGSRDNSLELLQGYAEAHSFIRVISFSRNFGHQIAVTAGLDHSQAHYVCIIDADLQDAPELVLPMYEKAKAEKLNVVYGQRDAREGESPVKKMTAKWFYRLLRWTCSIDIPVDTGDFRLIDRKVLAAIKRMREPHRFLRGMMPWVGFRSAPFHYNRDARYAGETKYPMRKMILFAVDAILSFSNIPLRIAAYFGVLVALVGLSGVFYMLYLALFTDVVIPGIMVLLITTVLLGGFQIIFLGLIGGYIGRIFEQTKFRPLYFINTTYNFGDDDPAQAGASRPE